MGAKPTTITGLSGTGDIMLTCFVNLSRNRTVGVRLGSGQKLEDILNSMNQVFFRTFEVTVAMQIFGNWCGYLVSIP